MRFLDDRISLINRSLASQTQLRRGQRNSPARSGELRRKYGSYRRLYRRLARSGPAWARPYLAMMGELMGELSPR